MTVRSSPRAAVTWQRPDGMTVLQDHEAYLLIQDDTAGIGLVISELDEEDLGLWICTLRVKADNVKTSTGTFSNLLIGQETIAIFLNMDG